EEHRARRFVVLVIPAWAAGPELEGARVAATRRLEEDGVEAAFQEQQRLRAARDEADRRLAALLESDSEAKAG
ncbi:MAG: DNA primase, partial [Sphingomonadaceae bacterium]